MRLWHNSVIFVCTWSSLIQHPMHLRTQSGRDYTGSSMPSVLLRSTFTNACVLCQYLHLDDCKKLVSMILYRTKEGLCHITYIHQLQLFLLVASYFGDYYIITQHTDVFVHSFGIQ